MKSPTRIVYLCDWLPPDFGAVGQYAVRFARAAAIEGAQVTLVGFTSGAPLESRSSFGDGELTIRKIRREPYDRSNWLQRALWTVSANLALLWGARHALRRAHEVRFTGSPPYLLHFIMPVALSLGIRTLYRITDFHPECLMAALDRAPLWLRAIQALTVFWRRRVDQIEVLGEDQRCRLQGYGIGGEQVVLRRDPSPVRFEVRTPGHAVPDELRGKKLILYSGNWGVAHDYRTFIEGFNVYCLAHPGTAGLWLNAVGKRADLVAAELKRHRLPHVRTAPVPLARLPSVLRAADVHLITLEDNFVGYVLPSKVYACVASSKPVMFIGSQSSDVDLVCRENMPATQYRRADVGNALAVATGLHELLTARRDDPARSPIQVTRNRSLAI